MGITDTEHTNVLSTNEHTFIKGALKDQNCKASLSASVAANGLRTPLSVNII